MDIHKPKPWHGAREFLKEYVIIVVGVLTALGAEAVAENLHERRLSAEAKEAVRAELNIDITNLNRRAAQEACLTRRLGEFQDLLDRAEAGGGSFTPPTTIGGPLDTVIFTQRWQAATAGGRTSLLSSDEQRAYGRIYAMLDDLAGKQAEEHRVWTRLRGLRELRRLSPAMVESQRMALSAARDADTLVRSDIQDAKFYAGRIGVKGDAHLEIRPVPAGMPSAANPSLCKSLDAPDPTNPQGSAHGHP